MSIRLNGSTSGYVEIDAPAVAGTTSITLPATSGEALVKAADGSVDLGGVDIDSSGRLLVGTSSGSSSALLQIQGNTSSSTAQSSLVLRRGSTPGGSDALGYLIFADNSENQGAYIGVTRDGGTWTSGSSHPSRLVFSTTADGASSPTERMVISSNGNIEVNNNGGQLQLSDGTAASPGLTFWSDGGANVGIFRPGADILGFTTAGTERMRIANDGKVNIGTTTSRAQLDIGFNSASVVGLALSNAGTGTSVRFYSGASIVGSITVSGSNTSYNTSSDYRLKENVVPLTGAADRVNQLQVHRFNFITDPDNTVDGFLAHEAQAVVPEAVTGTHDEVDADGNPVYQGIDQSKLVPLLTAALQEALAKIETLEARLTALEGGQP